MLKALDFRGGFAFLTVENTIEFPVVLKPILAGLDSGRRWMTARTDPLISGIKRKLIVVGPVLANDG